MKNKTTAALLAFFLGGFGAHKFYLGRSGMGLLYLVFFWTWIPALVAFVEFILLLVMDEHEFNLKYNTLFMATSGTGQVQNQNTQAQNITINLPPSEAGGAWPQQPPPSQLPVAQNQSVDVVASLTRLNDLRVAGALTDEEFDEQKQKLLTP